MRVGDAYPSLDLRRIRRERPCDQKEVPDTLPDGSHIVPDSSSRLEMCPSRLEEAGCWNGDTVFSFANRIYWNADAVFNFADRIYQNADAAISPENSDLRLLNPVYHPGNTICWNGDAFIQPGNRAFPDGKRNYLRGNSATSFGNSIFRNGKPISWSGNCHFMTVKAVITSGIGFEAGANRLFTQKIIDYLPLGSFITPAKRRHRPHGQSILFAITPNFNNFHHTSGICPIVAALPDAVVLLDLGRVRAVVTENRKLTFSPLRPNHLPL